MATEVLDKCREACPVRRYQAGRADGTRPHRRRVEPALFSTPQRRMRRGSHVAVRSLSRNHGRMRRLAEKYLKLRGWQFTGQKPPFGKFIGIGAPHTSNWDFIIFLAVVSRFRLPARVIGKKSLMRWPFGGLMRRLGVIPIDRDSGQGLVEQMVSEFRRAEAIALVVAPEGTRGPAEYWRSGFYRIAVAAEVPIVLTYIDFPTSARWSWTDAASNRRYRCRYERDPRFLFRHPRQASGERITDPPA